MTYRIELEPDDNGTFLVTCPALPGVVSYGETTEACVQHGRDAIQEAIASRIAGGVDVPLDTVEVGAKATVLTVDLPPMTELKLDLYRALRGAGVTRAELARRLSWNRNSVDRLFQLDHNSRLEQLAAAARAIGMVLEAHIVTPEYA